MARFSLEDRIQGEVVGLLEVAAVPGLLWFAVPNGGHRAKSVAAILKATGIKPGVSDIVGCHAALGVGFLEIKTEARGSGLSKAQRDFRDECEAKGFAYAVARSRDEAQDILTRWGFLRVATPNEKIA